MCYSSPHAAVRHLTCSHLISLCLSEALTLAQHWVNWTDVGGTCQKSLACFVQKLENIFTRQLSWGDCYCGLDLKCLQKLMF